MEPRFYLLLVVILVVFDLPSMNAQECSHSAYNKFASKTPYRFVKPKEDVKPVSFPNCKPVQVYFIARHGTRYPGASDVIDMIHRVPKLQETILQNAEEGKGHLCPEDKVYLKNWKINFNGSSTNLLAAEGRDELVAIGRTLKSQFPELLGEPYSSSNYVFRTTDTQRTIESAKAFTEGLLLSSKGVEYDILKDDELLRSYKICSRWEKEVDDNDTAHFEFFKFIREAHMIDAVRSVTSRIGLNETLTYANISILYEMCRFDTAWDPKFAEDISPWCHLFDNVDLQVMEFSEDLKYYWKNGYGHPLNFEIACPLVKNLLDSFRQTIAFSGDKNDPSKPRLGLFHFTHSGMMLKLYSRLGLFKDSAPLEASSYSSQTHRKWKTSDIDPFAGNIAFVLFNCSTKNVEEFRVATYVQQKEVILPNCTSFLCPFDVFENTYGNLADKCNLAEICKGNNSSSALIISTTVLVTLIAALAVRYAFW